MKPITLFVAGLLALTGLTLTSCSDLLEVKPRTTIDLQQSLTSPEGLEAAMNGIYDRLQLYQLYGRDYLALPEALSDNGRATNKSGRLNPEYRNTVNAHFVNWPFSYIAINQANLILDAAPNVTITDTTRRNTILGQAYFLRALLYHDLMRAYAYDPGVEVPEYNRGGVPLVTKGVSTQDQITYSGRASIKEVYDFIYSDLQNAVRLLTNANTPTYANRVAAQLLFSRVALYRKDYATAAQFATAAITAGTIRLMDNASYIAGWRAPRNPESVFELVFVTNENIGVNLALQTTYTTLVRTGDRNTTGGFGDLVPTASLLADLESEKSAAGAVLDIRRQLYELGTAGRGAAEIECTKFLGKNGTINLDNVPVLRISEAYLNRAEANAMLGNTASALADVNAIRTRAGLPAKTDLTGDNLMAEILKQARIEFAFEGHRWFDLKRRGQDITKAPANLPYTDFRILANIPINDLQTNKSIQQNYGY